MKTTLDLFDELIRAHSEAYGGTEDFYMLSDDAIGCRYGGYCINLKSDGWRYGANLKPYPTPAEAYKNRDMITTHLSFDISLPDRPEAGLCHVEFDALFNPNSGKKWDADSNSVQVRLGDEGITVSDLDQNSWLIISERIVEMMETLDRAPVESAKPALWVFSGKVPLCEIGKPTTLIDRDGRPLFTGDIVTIFTVDSDDNIRHSSEVLSCVLELTEEKDLSLHGVTRPGPWVMGIRDVDLSNSQWRVLRLKSWKNVIKGEHWEDYEFSFNYNPTKA